MYAVVKIGNTQYRVTEGENLDIDRLEKKPGDKIEFSEVLLVVNDKKSFIGQPLVSGAKVTALVLDQISGEKIRIARFKAKSRHRRVQGFRSKLTKIKIGKISLNE